MTNQEKLTKLRQIMQQRQIDAYLIPSSDPHISEYLPDRFKSIYWLSGFTGSAGTIVVTQKSAGLWTDSRYFVQATEQLAGSGIDLMKLRVQNAPEYAEWMANELPAGAVVAFDGKTAAAQLTQYLRQKLEGAGLHLNGEVDLPKEIWEDRPDLPTEPAYLVDDGVHGQSRSEKLAQIRERMQAHFADYHLVSTLDDLAWILNIRGHDVHCNPVVLGFLLLGPTTTSLFIDRGKLSEQDQRQLEADGIEMEPYEQVWAAVSQLPPASPVLIDPKRTCHQLYHAIPDTDKIVEAINPSTDLKAVKNEQEIDQTRKTMMIDGVAMTRFFKWLESALASDQPLNEISIAEKLRAFRAEQPGFVGESFDTIAGYRAHGALPHYKATEESNSFLERRGLLLLDSGGQYLTGTTDITRVVSLGEVTSAEKADYTIVLRGMIEGSSSIFPEGTRGYQIDAITRKPLWDNLRNYGHGTGHGVGFFLNVHEGPQVFNAAPIDVPIRSGMITSIEPGLYREGEYGIRIENLVLARDLEESVFGRFMHFETLTLCYISTDLIEPSLLDRNHVAWLNAYNQLVFDKLSPFLTLEEVEWLRAKTRPI